MQLRRAFISWFPHSRQLGLSSTISISKRTMSTKSIAVLDENELKDGQMYAQLLFCPHSRDVTDCKPNIIQEGGCVWGRKGPPITFGGPSSCNECILHALRCSSRERCPDFRWKNRLASAYKFPSVLFCLLSFAVHGTEVILLLHRFQFSIELVNSLL